MKISLKVLSICALAALLAPPPVVAGNGKPNQPPLTITRVNPDFTGCVLDIFGDNFGDATPTVILDGTFLLVLGSTPNHLVAEFNCSLEPGDYLLEVERGIHPKTSSDFLSLTLRDDGDTDPTNEIQEIERTGDQVCLLDPDGGCANIEDADADPANEIQQLSKAGSTVSLSKGGGSFNDDVDDADADPTNELQTVAYSPATKELSVNPSGNSVSLGVDVPCFNNEDRFMDCGNGTVTDLRFGLIWLKDADCDGKKDWAAASSWAAGLGDGQCGLTDGSGPGDWRLPTLDEWETIMVAPILNGCGVPYIPDTEGTGCWSEGDPFTGVQSDDYWSSSGTYLLTSAYHADLTDDILSSVGSSSKSSEFYCWPIRDGH